MKCEAASVTMDAQAAERFCEAFHGNCMIEAGHGIMACSLQKDKFSINDMKNISFFDEIV